MLSVAARNLTTVAGQGAGQEGDGMDLGEAERLGRRLMAEHGLRGWTLVFDRAKQRAGICRYGRKEIGLSAALTALHPEDEVRDTILHEIAHALAGPRHGHDEVWRATARRIGCSGQRCTSSDAPRVPGDWVGTCPAGHRVTRHRRPERPASCPTCCPAFSVDHLFTWTHRGEPAPMSKADFVAGQVQRFQRQDADKDGNLTKSERDAFRAQMMQRFQQGGGQ